MRVLQDILYKISIQTVVGNTDIPVSSVEIDSRLVKQASCFIAIKGASSDGHLYISNAIASGASAVVCEEIPVNIEPHVTYIQTNDAAKAAGIMCHAFHDHPTNKLKLLGITGTNGKTTVATVLFNLCREMGMSAGLISTVNNRINDQMIPSTHTTGCCSAQSAIASNVGYRMCIRIHESKQPCYSSAKNQRSAF